MMRWIVGFSLKFRLLLVPVAAALILAGAAQLRRAPVDVLPEFTLPVVQVQTESLGLSGAEVEQLITVPLEQDLLNGVRGVESIRSDSVPGLSSIVMTFERGTDILDARLLVQERLSQSHAGALANVSKPSQMLPPVSSTNRVMMIGLSTTKLSPIELSVLARWTVRPRLMGLPGVANVAIWGHRDRQLQVLVDHRRLHDRGVSLGQVIRTTGNAQLVSPLSFVEASTPGTGGFIDGPNQRLGVRHVVPLGRPSNLAQVPIEGARGRGLRLGDVATVVEDHQPLIGDGLVGSGRPGHGLVLVVEKLPGAGTLSVTREVQDALDELRPGLAGVRIDAHVFRPASYIESAIDNLAVLAGIAAALVVLALLAFSYRWRAVLISVVALALSLVTALLVLVLAGGTINALVVAGLAVALGFLVADATGDVHSIARRLRARPKIRGDRSRTRTVLEGSLQMRRTAGYATLIALLAIVPVFFVGGLTGAFVHPVAVSYGLAVVASMAVALIVTPALSLLLLPRRPRERSGSPVASRLAGGSTAALARLIRTPRPALFTLAGLLAVAVVALPLLGQSPLPSFRDRDLLVKWNATPSTSLAEMERITARARRELASLPGVDDVGAHVGRAVSGDQVVGTGSGEMWVSIDERADYDSTLRSIREVVHGYPGLRGTVLTYENDRTRDVLTPADDGVLVRVYGQDYRVLRREAQKLRRDLSHIEGIRSPRVQSPVQQPTVQVTVDLAAARRRGIKPGDVRRAAGTLVNGLEVGSFFEKQKVFSVVVRGAPSATRSPSSVRDLSLDTPGGGHVRLGDVARVRIGPDPVDIRHDAVSRYVDVRADVRGRPLGAVQADVQRRLRSMTLPLEYHAELVRPPEDVQDPAGREARFAIAAAIGIFLLLQAAFSSWRLAALLFATLPAAPAGGLLVVLAGGGGLSLGAALGLVAVLGIAARNGVLLITRFQELESVEGEPPGQALVLRGTRERSVPILVAAVTTGLALLPFALAGGIAGNEITHSLAAVVLGGLVTSTVISLVVVPSAYLHHMAAPPAPVAPPPRAPAPPPIPRLHAKA